MLSKKLLIMFATTSLISTSLGFILMSFYINTSLNGLAKAPSINLNVLKKEPCNTCVYITKSSELNKQGSPILKATVYINGKYQKEFRTLSGRSYTQDLDRNVAGNKSPLPNGEYSIGELTKGTVAETGYVFIPFTPTFITQRSSLETGASV